MRSKYIITIIIFLCVLFIVLFFSLKNLEIEKIESPSFSKLNNTSSTSEKNIQTKETIILKNLYWNVPCINNSDIKFTHDFTEIDKISSVEPTIITPGNSRHRAWLNIKSGQKVAVYAPVDSELISGVYKSARGATDYDLHFQVSCEIWYLINHITEPIEKIKNVFPSTPQTDTRDSPKLSEFIRFKAGELLGYTTGTPLANNFDFGVFDLNHINDQLPAEGNLLYGKEKNFICPFDVLPLELKNKYYSKLNPSEIKESNCKEI